MIDKIEITKHGEDMAVAIYSNGKEVYWGERMPLEDKKYIVKALLKAAQFFGHFLRKEEGKRSFPINNI